MTALAFREKKLAMLRMMTEVCGQDFTFGWLQSAYIYPDGDLAEDILERTVKQLEDLKAKKEAEVNEV